MLANFDKPKVDLEAFREKLKEYRQLAGYSQKSLADELGLHKVVLSNKLNGTPRYNLTIPEVKQIILTLADWEAILTQKEAKELVALAGLPSNVFSQAEWQTAPLNKLEITPPDLTSAQAPATASPKPALLHNLPAQLTALVGRKDELVRAQELLQKPKTRLLTLTGIGGVGKTRVAIQLGTNLVEEFRDGVFFVTLVSLKDAGLVVPAIAQNLKIPGQPTLDSLKNYLKAKQLLLILDNFEHLTQATNILPVLLDTAPQLKIVVTSRVVLHLPGEQLFEVPPLAVRKQLSEQENLDSRPNFTELASNEAIELFVQRTRALNPNFTLNPENAQIIEQICYKLEGLPLALELAAARTRLFSLSAILERLSIGLLASGARSSVAHHQTLQATLDWSYQLLEPTEKTLFTRLAIFSGEFNLDAITAICLPEEAQPEIIAQLMNSLKDKSLVKEAPVNQEIIENPNTTPNEIIRFGMLETLKEYGTALLNKHEQKRALEQRYLDYYTNLAERIGGKLIGVLQPYWLARLELERANLRTALKLALELAETEKALRLAGALSRFWWMGGYLAEGQQWLEAVLEAAETGSQVIRPELKTKALLGLALILRQAGQHARASKIYEEVIALAEITNDLSAIAGSLHNLGIIYSHQSKFEESIPIFEKSLALHKQLDNKYMIAANLNVLGAVAVQQTNWKQGQLYFEECLTYLQESGDIQGTSFVLSNIGVSAHELGNYAQAVDYYQKALALQRKLGNNFGIALSLNNLGVVAQEQGEYEEAIEWHEQSLKFCRKQGEQRGIAVCLCSLGQVALYTHNYAEAQAKLKESLQIYSERKELRAIAIVLEAFGGLAVETGQLQRAAWLLGAAQKLRDTIKAPLSPAKLTQYNYYLNKLQTQFAGLEDTENGNFKTFWDEGYAAELKAVIESVLAAPKIN